MAFAATQTGQTVMGNMRMVYGTYTQAGTDEGGDIIHGLTQLKVFNATAAATTTACATDKKVAITTAQGPETGFWFALGY